MSPSSSVRERSQTPDPERALKVADKRWEVFPEPRPGGYWIPKDRPFPRSKFPDKHPPNAPADVPPLIDPPIMQFACATQPTPASHSRQDPDWLSNLFADLEREHARVHGFSKECRTSIDTTHRASGLWIAELDEEGKDMQDFLNALGKISGTGFLKDIMQDVDGEVNDMFCEPQDDEENRDKPSSRSGGRNGATRL